MLRKIGVLALLFSLAGLLAITACDRENPVAVNSEESAISVPEEALPPKGGIDGLQKAQYWADHVVSEAKYALSRSRSGGSSVSYHGYAMSDWNYVESDRSADRRISWWIGGCGKRGKAGGIVSLRDWNGRWKRCHRGGYCRYFVNLILYRSSYGWGNGRHLVLPRSGTGYATGSIYAARPGWVIQAGGTYHGPHTAIVIKVMSGGLDVIDSNWVGTYYSTKTRKWVYRYLISRHEISWRTLKARNFKSFNPWSDPVTLISRSGSRTQCY